MADAAETKAALEFVCQSLRSKLPGAHIDAECLRRAKHDDPSVLPHMWDVIIHILGFHQGAQEKCIPYIPQTLHQQHMASEGVWFQRAAVYCLSARGYPRSDKLLEVWVSESSERGSRELLLALAFLLDVMDLLSHHGTLAPYPQDISQGNHKEDKTVESDSLKSDTPNLHVLLQLHSKWQNEMRRLQHLDAHRLDVLQKLQVLGGRCVETKGVKGVKGVKQIAPPTQYELFVLERPALLLEHFQDLEHDIEVHSSHIKKEELFWRWMGSVLKAADGATFHSPNQSEGLLQSFRTQGDFFSDEVLKSMEKFGKSWQSLERNGQPLPGTERWKGDLREHWEMHKMLPQEVQQVLKAELRNLGRSFDETLPSPWQSSFQPPESLQVSEVFKGAKTSRQVPAQQDVTKRSKTAAAVADLREGYAKTLQRHTALRTMASQKLEKALALAARDVFVGRSKDNKEQGDG